MPKQICKMCGAEFCTRGLSDYCSACRPIYWRQYNTKYNQAHREERKAKAAEYWNNNKEKLKDTRRAYYLKNCEKIKAAVTRRRKGIPALETSVIEVLGQRITMYHCDRLRLKAKHLPCGDRYQCWEGTPCPHIPKGKEQVTFKNETTDKSWWQQSKIKPTFEEVE